LIALTDDQLKLLMQMASVLPVDLRDEFLRLTADQLKIKSNDVEDAGRRALAYLHHGSK
jgi:propanediol dehydratase small subunit